MNQIDTYLIIGTPASGRRGVILDIIEKALSEDEFCGVFIAESESISESDKKIAGAQNAGIIRYSDTQDAAEKIASLDKNKFNKIFLLANSANNIADEIESFKEILDEGHIRLVRIWGVLDCGLLMKYPEQTRPFADAMAHFSDCFLLSRREALENKDIAEIKAPYEKQCYPLMFEFVDKNFKVKHPIELLIDQTRRISTLFDDFDPLDDLDLDEDNLPEEPFDLTRKPDPYIERLQNGLRAKPVPNVSKIASALWAKKE